MAPGTSVSRNLDFTVRSGIEGPPDGSVLTLVVEDLDRAASVSRSVLVQ